MGGLGWTSDLGFVLPLFAIMMTLSGGSALSLPPGCFHEFDFGGPAEFTPIS